MGKSIAIVQTSAVSSAELTALCKEIIPEVKVWEIIDSSLIAEVNANGGVTKAVRRRMLSYYQNAQSLGVDAILNQCSSVSEVAEELKQMIDVPVVKIDEAMAHEAVRLGKKIGVVATVETTVGPSCRLIERAALKAGKEIEIQRYLVEGAMMVLIEQGDRDRHNEMVLGEVEKAAENCDVVVLAQGSMTVLLPLLTHIKTPVLSSPRMGIEYLKEVLGE
ncbi:MAG: aspartate/glutamate racemase family protein [Christensenella sp.]|nr:aspartate/glutamate racemase family protein [Christensenella sp.]MEA5003647.1 aspartate/glutamate racemase family protein [Christensenella sp.]